MYQPIQPHHLFHKEYEEKINYTEIYLPDLADVLVCMWESIAIDFSGTMNDVIIADGCSDLIVNVLEKSVFYTGSSKTDFNFISNFPEHYIGFRLKPGAFFALTGREATEAMDKVLPLEEVALDFDTTQFFTLTIEEMKETLIGHLSGLAELIINNEYIKLFEDLYVKKMSSTQELYEYMGLSPRQVQRLFKKHYGLTPQMGLSIIKFHHSLTILFTQPTDRKVLVENYYDQSHFINEFKKNIGLTPSEFIKLSEQRKMSLLSNTLLR
ncbi:helix-turn-helix transcriptional regulator [Enterococcus sp. DIV1298c]|uniref:helix-turn-helix domain-containing protein n=1 Tax=Enterococcus sp. DIV1298c TaxID=2815328 RepID=UPI001A90D6F6|nr:helix-turn-helix domain-containing protein [Enterococcus sp. DIV1298c]MBO0461174.1 helix-turn-helix transcriptional regulator [Enterococcus sp. DIV1298c]